MRLFVTGASGWIGSATVPELLSAGHQVVGLARSEESAAALAAAGAEVVHGSLDDLDVLGSAAADSDGVIHLAFNHELAFATGDFLGAAKADRAAIETFGDALAGTDRPFLLASGVLGLPPGQRSTEQDGRELVPGMPEGPAMRHANAHLTLSFAERGIRSSVVRLPPTCHGAGDNGFIKTIVDAASTNGFSGYIGDGTNHWPATHRLDVAHAFRLGAEKAPAGSVLHAIAEEGVATRAIAEAIGRSLDLPVRSVPQEDAVAHFGFLGHFFGADAKCSSTWTRETLGWEPTHQTLIEDLDAGSYVA
jgi:nucleoside-diphosphate-sugar epimerase